MMSVVDDSRGIRLGDGLTIIPFDPANPKSSKNRAVSGPAYMPRKRFVSEEEKANVKAVKAKGACLRCKILKKQCDDEQPCKQCPYQGYGAQGDHWKVLGCHRGNLAELVDILIPEWLDQDHRKIGPVRVRFSAKESIPDKQQMLSDLTRMIDPESTFGALSNELWDQRHSFRQHAMRERAQEEYSSGNNWKGLETAWELIEVGKADQVYSLPTAYNPFKLLRDMESAEVALPFVTTRNSGNFNTWEISRKLVVGACAYWQREHQCLSIGRNLHDNEHYQDVTNIFLNVKHYALPALKSDLKTSLTIIEEICSRRNSMHLPEWLCIFYLLIAISIVHSTLVDTHLLRYQCDGRPKAFANNTASRIKSVYYVLVSLFGWASGSMDPLLQDHNVSDFCNLMPIVQEARQLVRLDDWQRRNIKSTRDFLSRLGKQTLSDGVYSGFVIQKQELAKDGLTKFAYQPVQDGSELNTSEKILQLRNISEEVYTVPKPDEFSLRIVPAPVYDGSASYNAWTAKHKTHEILQRGRLGSCTQRHRSDERLNEVPQGDFMEGVEPIVIRCTERIVRRHDGRKPMPDIATENIDLSMRGATSPHIIIETAQSGGCLWNYSSIGNPKDTGRSCHAIIHDGNQALIERVKKRNDVGHSTVTLMFRQTRRSSSPRSTTSSLQSGGTGMSKSSRSSSNNSIQSHLRIEASFLRDFNCCGEIFPTLHDLSEHHLSQHPQPVPIDTQTTLLLEKVESACGDLSNTMLTGAETTNALGDIEKTQPLLKDGAAAVS